MRVAALLLCVSVMLSAGCPQMAKWRDSQVAESHTLAQGDKVVPPVTPPAKASDLAGNLPVDPSWLVYEYSDKDGVDVKLISTAGAEKTTEWIDGKLHEMGYDSGDNMSRLLDGVSYSGKGKYSSIWIKVDMNSSDQVLVEERGSA